MKLYAVLCLFAWIAIPIVASKVKVHPCDIDNGGCSHLCIPMKGGEVECECPDGLELMKGGKLCREDYSTEMPTEEIIPFKHPKFRAMEEKHEKYEEIKPIKPIEQDEEKFQDARTHAQNPPCRVGKKMYKKGQSFTRGCEECTCFGDAIGCKPVCPKIMVPCDGGLKVVFDKNPVKGWAGCSCNVPRCVMDPGSKKIAYKKISHPPCRVGENVYEYMNTFIKDCELCTCLGDAYQCKALCPLEFVRCDGGQKVVHDKSPLAGHPGCFCNEPRCDSEPVYSVHDQTAADVTADDERDSDIFELAADRIVL